MSNLIQALNRSMQWIEGHLPEYAASFLPGLSFDEILDEVETLGFPLSDELYELYQWRNGTDSEAPSMVFPIFEFLPLEKVVEFIQQAEDDAMIRSLLSFNGQPLFPFMANDGRYCASIVSRRSTMTNPVIYIGKQGSSEYVAFSSITSMMFSLTECFETGAYYLDEDDYIDADANKLAGVLRRRNPQLVEEALLNARVLLTEFEFNYEMRMFISRTLHALERFRPPEAIAILTEALSRYSSDDRSENSVIHSQIARCLQIIQQSQSL